MRKLKIIGVSVFLEKRKTRLRVGILKKIKGRFSFAYDDRYFKAKHVIPLGPEFPLTQKEFSSNRLFPSLEDRIPSRQNPAYPEYCQAMGIAPEEKDPIILLCTIGRKGPSSFVFYPLFERKVTPEEVIAFRKSLGLSTREFASVFEFSQTSLNAFEKKRRSGREIVGRLEILLNFRDVALHLLLMNGGNLSYEKLSKSISSLKQTKL